MADEHWGEAARVRRHVRTILEQLTAREREQRTADKVASRPASANVSGEVEREENRAVGIGNLKRPA